MAPCTYVGLPLVAAPSGRMRFESLKFADADGQHSLPVFSPVKLYTSGI
jgi:hypothetical protein